MLTVRIGGLVALVFLVLPPGKAAFLAVELAVFGFHRARRSRRTTSACRWSRRG